MYTTKRSFFLPNALLLSAILFLHGCIPDTAPDAFSFESKTRVAAATLIESEPVTVSGIQIPAPLSITGGDAGTSDAGRDSGGIDAGPGEPVDPFEGMGEVELVATEGPDQGFVFLEGPTWHDGALLFTDIPANRIYRLNPPGAIDVFRNDSGGANGLETDTDGNLLACEHGNRRVSVTRGSEVGSLAGWLDLYLDYL